MLRRTVFLAGLAIAPFAFGQTQVTLVVVPQSEICKGPYKPGHSDCQMTAERFDFLRQKYASVKYSLRPGKPIPLPLDPRFQQALTAGIAARNYAVLLEFDWGSTLLARIDFARDLCGHPNVHPPWDQSKHWYTHQDARDFDPDKSVQWQVTVAGASQLLFCFYVLPAV